MICPDKVTHSFPLQQPLHIQKLLPVCSATSRHFHLPPHYEDLMVTMHVSLYKATFNTINVSTQHFQIWQHFHSNQTTAYIQRLADVLEIPMAHLYKHMIGQSETVLPFEINREMKEGTSLKYKLLNTQDPHRSYWCGICCMYRCLLP